MNTKKPGFLLYLNQKEIIDELTDEEAGILLKAIFQYEETKQVPKLNKVLKIIFFQLKNTLDNDEKKYDEICKKNKKNALKRWSKADEQNDANACDRMRTDANININRNKNRNKNKNININTLTSKDINVCNQATPDNNSRASHDHTPSIFVEIVACFNRVGIVEDHFQKNKIEFHFKNTKQTQQLIQNVLDRGYTKEDIFDVIFLKYDQWIENKQNNKIDMSQYYRPSTILGEKFDEYFQEAKMKGIS